MYFLISTEFNNYFKAYYLNKFLYEEATKTDTIVFGIALEPLETHYNKIWETQTTTGGFLRLKNDLFFDEISKRLYTQLPNLSPVLSHVMLNIEQFEIASRYVTAKVQNRYGENVTINIQGGRPGIELQESFFKIKEAKNGDPPSYAYLITRLAQDNSKIFTRKLPVVGQRDWLLIYEDTLLELSVKDAYDELEIIVVWFISVFLYSTIQIDCFELTVFYCNMGSLILMFSISFSRWFRDCSKYGINFILVFV